MADEKSSKKVLSNSSSRRVKNGEEVSNLSLKGKIDNKEESSMKKSSSRRSTSKSKKVADDLTEKKKTNKERVKSTEEDKTIDNKDIIIGNVDSIKKKSSTKSAKIKSSSIKNKVNDAAGDDIKDESEKVKVSSKNSIVDKDTNKNKKKSTRASSSIVENVVSEDIMPKLKEDKDTTVNKKSTVKSVKDKKKSGSDSKGKGAVKTRRKSNTTKTSSVVIDLVEEGLDKTGALSKINEGTYVSKLINDNKIISITKVRDKKEKNKSLDFDGKFRLDILDILIIIVITAIISCVFTGLVINYQYKKVTNLYDESVLKDENVNEFLSLYSEILNNYYEEVDSKAMIRAAMNGMISFLEDTYSIYMSEEDSSDLTGMLDSSYDGIGIVIEGNIIRAVYKNSPAANAGLGIDDEIIKINDTLITMENYINISDYLKKDENNTIVVKRDGEELTFEVEMSKVNIPTVSPTMIQSKGKNIGFIKVSSFSNLTNEEFAESLVELENQGMESLIIDLRSNSGGYLKAAHDISSIFIEKDKIIYSLEQKDKVTEYKDETKDKREYKIVVIVNNSTASAAEIMASALHDSYGATIVGKTTYGKGKVQTLKQYDDALVKYTSAKWLRPNGECIDGVGITPDYEVDIEYSNSQIYDKQLDKAIELLSK